MKAHRETPKPAFIPVTLTLESQAEVDGVSALFNNAKINETAGLPHDSYKSLNSFMDRDNTDFIHEKLQGLIE